MSNMAKDYKKFWESMTSEERYDWVDYHFNKYRKMGYEVAHFRSASFISFKDGKSITYHKTFFHEFKCIDDMEEYLKKEQHENE
jgi:hypothetical protein